MFASSYDESPHVEQPTPRSMCCGCGVSPPGLPVSSHRLISRDVNFFEGEDGEDGDDGADGAPGLQVMSVDVTFDRQE